MTDNKKEDTELNQEENEGQTSSNTDESKLSKEEIIKKRLEELRKRDPFIYR